MLKWRTGSEITKGLGVPVEGVALTPEDLVANVTSGAVKMPAFVDPLYGASILDWVRPTTSMKLLILLLVSRHRTVPTALCVDGQPFLILGAQVGNSSGWKEPLDRAWPLYKQLNANTAEIPVYWR